GVLLCRPGSELDRAARAAGLRVVGECFADRAYRPDGRLVPRGLPGALLDRAAAVAQAVDLAAHGEVTAVDGTRIRVEAASICVHGDGPEPVATGEAIRSALDDKGIKVEAFL
ncbi:LamB/YcsF family protein, partial [Glycomyces tenuis]